MTGCCFIRLWSAKDGRKDNQEMDKKKEVEEVLS